MSTAVKYSLFAFLAVLINLAFQYACSYLYSGKYSLYVAMACGTFAGLVVKYSLDKRFIFYYQPKTNIHNVEKFTAYTFTGIVTTALFWVIEILFDTLIDYSGAKYIGAVLGLTLGYSVKYQLDKKYVFLD